MKRYQYVNVHIGKLIGAKSEDHRAVIDEHAAKGYRYVGYISDEFQDIFQKDSEGFVDRIADAPLNELVLVGEDYLRPYLNFIYNNRGVFKASMKNPSSMQSYSRYSRLQQYIFEPIMERFDIPKEMHSYWTSFYIRGIWAIIEEWLNRDCKETIEQIESVILNCVRPEDGFKDRKFGE